MGSIDFTIVSKQVAQGLRDRFKNQNRSETYSLQLYVTWTALGNLTTEVSTYRAGVRQIPHDPSAP